MKNYILALLSVCALLLVVSCRDTSEKEAEEQQMIEKIDSVEQKAINVEAEIKEDAAELEQALQELDSIN